MRITSKQDGFWTVRRVFQAVYFLFHKCGPRCKGHSEVTILMPGSWPDRLRDKILSWFVILAILAVVGSCFGQTAQVIQLSPEDAAQAKALYEQKAAIDQKIKDLYQHFTYKYTSEPFDDPKLHSMGGVKKGWEGGFEFSADFRFIVPKAAARFPDNPWTFFGSEGSEPGTYPKPINWHDPQPFCVIDKGVKTCSSN